MYMDKIKKAAVTGVITAVAAQAFFPQVERGQIFGMEVSPMLAVGIAGAASSVAADVAHEYVLPMIPGNAKYSNIESAALGVGVSGASTAYLLVGGPGGNDAFMPAFAVGAASYVAGDYITEKWGMGSSYVIH